MKFTFQLSEFHENQILKRKPNPQTKYQTFSLLCYSRCTVILECSQEGIVRWPRGFHEVTDVHGLGASARAGSQLPARATDGLSQRHVARRARAACELPDSQQLLFEIVLDRFYHL